MVRPGKKMAVSFAGPVTSSGSSSVVPLYENGVAPCQNLKLHISADVAFRMTVEPWSRHWFAFATAPPAAVLTPTCTKNWCVYWASVWNGAPAAITPVTFESQRSPWTPGSVGGTAHVEPESIQNGPEDVARGDERLAPNAVKFTRGAGGVPPGPLTE